MKKMIVKSVFKNYGIFHYLNEIQTLPFIDEFSPENLDSLFVSSFGKKTVSEFVTNNMTDFEMTESGMNHIAQIIHSMFYSKWNRLYSIMLSDLKLLESYSDTVKEIAHDKGENSTDFSSELTSGNTSKVSAFNNDDFVNRESDDRTDTGKNISKAKNKNERVKEVIKSGFKGNAVAEYENAINYLQNNLIYDTIFKDINGLVTIQIYDL